jgi:ABC-2 type transport system ATP-binding protein
MKNKIKSHTSKDSIVQINNISKKYKDILAVDNVSFDIKKGEIFGYIGPNGAGKTTTIKILVGLLKKTSGRVFINGYEMPEQKEQAHKFIGYLPQQVAFQQWRTLNHALTTFAKLSGMQKNRIQPRIDELLEIMKIITLKNKKINKLSGGTIQKVGIIQAILHNPSLLILDEPLDGLDPEGRYQVKQIFKDLSKNGTTIFFSSHILSDVQDVATKICIIDWGKILKIGTLDELKSEFIKEKQIEIILSKKSDKFKEINKLKGIQNIIEKSDKKFLININKNVSYDEIIHNIIKTLLKNECHIRSITPVTPTLDEVYQYYLRKGGYKQ